MSAPFHIFYNQDLYEVVLHGYVIARITKYLNGSQMREEVKYDDVPSEVQNKILDRVEIALKENES